MNEPDYPYVRAWGRFQGWPGERTAAALALARDDHAPDDACYKRGSHWIRVTELRTDGAIAHIEKLVVWIRKGH